MNSDFNRIITLIRKERKISQKQAASDLGISQALLSHYEKGIRECGLEFLCKAADYYGVSCDYLLGRSPSPQMQVTSSSEETGDINETTKMLNDSGNIIMKLCEEHDVTENIIGYMTASFYKLLRIIYNSNSENNKTAFKVTTEESEYLSECIISRESAEIKRKCSKNGIKITISELANNFPDSHSLLSLIKLTEDKINDSLSYSFLLSNH